MLNKTEKIKWCKFADPQLCYHGNVINKYSYKIIQCLKLRKKKLLVNQLKEKLNRNWNHFKCWWKQELSDLRNALNDVIKVKFLAMCAYISKEALLKWIIWVSTPRITEY